MNEYILTYDVGTTGSKVAIFDSEYELKSSVYQEYKTYYGPNGQVEQNPEDWWRAIGISTRKLLDRTKIAPDNIMCVSFTGQQTSLVPTNEEGKPSRKTAMIWMDSRAKKQAQLIRENLGWGKFYSITARGKILSSYPLTEIMWVRDNEPEVFGRTYKFMQVKDHIISRLTGEFVSDFSEASDTGMLDIRKREWSEEILEVAGIPKEMLPELHESSDVIGHVTKGASLELPLKVGTPVVVGGGDSTCALEGIGITEEEYCIYVGSAIWVGTVTQRPLFNPETRISSFCHLVPKNYNSLLVSYNGGSCYRWARDSFCDAEVSVAKELGIDAYKIMDSKANSVRAGAEGLLFSPHLIGGGPPSYDPIVKGSFVGLRVIHKKEHFLRSILEGVAYLAKTFVEQLESEKGRNTRKIKMIGGGAKSRLWRQIMADVIGADVMSPSSAQESTALGAAMAGGVGIGISKDFSKAKKSIKIVDVCHPKPEIHKIYSNLLNTHMTELKI